MSWDILPKSNLQYFLQKLKGKFDGKVDIVAGKGLSTNDYTTTEKNKLAGIESGAQVNTVTSVAGKTGEVTLAKGDVGLGNVDNTSDANKPISTATQNALNNKADNSDVIEADTPNSTPFLYRETPYEADRVFLDELVGGSVAWNQLLVSEHKQHSYNPTSDQSIYDITVATGLNIPIIQGHKYLLSAKMTRTISGNNLIGLILWSEIATSQAMIVWNNVDANGYKQAIFLPYSGQTSFQKISFNNYSGKTGFAAGDTMEYDDFNVIDLTQMFGTTIADYIYSLEQATAGSGIAWLKSYCFFTKDYYPYNTGELISVKTSGKKYVWKNRFDGYFANQSAALRIGDDYSDKSLSDLFGTNITKAPNGLKYICFCAYLPQGTYTLSNVTPNVYVSLNRVAIAGEVAIVASFHIREDGYIFTTAKDGYTWFSIERDDGYSSYTDIDFTGEILQFQIEKGTTVTPYEPHTTSIYDISNIDLRGIPKLVNNELVYDGDTYESDGDVTRKYGIVDLGTLDWDKDTTTRPADGATIHAFYAGWSLMKIINTGAIANMNCFQYVTDAVSNVDYGGGNTVKDRIIGGADANNRVWVYDSRYNDYTTTDFKSAMSGVYLIYELATPTTETTDPYTNPQICDKDGTEEFIDDRTVPVPVGHNSTYANLPSMMDGDYLSYMARNFASGEYVDRALEEVDTELDTKVDKVTGKGLSTNDYTNEEKALVETIPDKADADDVKGTQTATGNPITLTDASETYAQGLSVELEPKQDLHGYDFPWVGGAGKNKLPLDIATIKSLNTDGTWSGNTYTRNNVSFTIQTDNDGNVIGIDVSSNNAPAVTNLYLVKNYTIQDGSYIANGCPQGSVGNNYMIAVDNIGDDVGQGVNVNVSGNTLSIRIRVATTATFNTVRFLPMLRLSTETDPTFAPYSNICPISGYDGVEVDDVGKNKIDVSPVTMQSDGYYLSNYTLPQALPVGTYTISIKSSSNAAWSFWVHDENGNEVGAASSSSSISGVQSATFTTNGIGVVVGGYVNAATTLSEFMLESGSTPSPYEPYTTRTASVTFGQTVYGGNVDLTTGVLTVDKAFVEFDGSSDEQWENYTTYNGFNIEAQDMRSGWYLEGISNEFETINQHAYGIRFGADNNRIYVEYVTNNISGVSDLASWKTWLSNNPLQVCYPLAEPFTIQLTPQELKLLQDTNNLTTNGTTITLDYIPNNSIGDAVKASEEYTDRAVERVAVAPKATLIDTWMISEESDTISVDLTSYDCNFFLLEYLFQSKRGTTLIPRPQGGGFSASVVTYNNGSALYIELDYNPTTKELAYTSNITSQFGVLAIYTI